MKSLSRVRLFATPWTVAYQAPPSVGFSRQECWSGLPFPSPGDLPDPGIEPGSPALQADALLSEPPGKPVDYENGTLMSKIDILLRDMADAFSLGHVKIQLKESHEQTWRCVLIMHHGCQYLDVGVPSSHCFRTVMRKTFYLCHAVYGILS